MNQNEALLIRKLIFAKNSQDITHFCRCVEEMAQGFEQSGERESAHIIRNALYNGYVRSRFELSQQVQPEGCPYVTYEPAYTVEYRDAALRIARESTRPMRVRHILEYVECGNVVAKDVLEYNWDTEKWVRIEEECEALT